MKIGQLMVAVATCLLLASCAQTGPPLPPSLELPRPPSDLRATRKGDTVTLTWSQPQLTTDRQSVRYLGPTRICRATAPDMKDCSTPATETPAPTGRALHRPQPVTLTATDTLPQSFEEQNPIGDITYALEVLNRDQRSAGLSNLVRVPAVPALPPPQDLAAELTDDGIALTWTALAESNIAGIHHR